MNRLQQTRQLIDSILLEMKDPVERRCAYIHLYSVSELAAMLAKKRGLNPELAAISGMFHDLYSYQTGVINHLHDQNGAEAIRPVVRELKIFSPEEQQCLISAVFHHCDKAHRHQPYDEVLKDADVLQSYLYNTSLPVYPVRAARLRAILSELGLPVEFKIDEPKPAIRNDHAQTNKRAALADLSEVLAVKGIIGLPEDEHYQIICHYWTGDDIYNVFKDNWCAAFVYHCCMEVGYVLPMRHPLVSCRFGGVKGWLEWAQLPENQFFHPLNEPGFTPTRGDLVIYEQLLSNNAHDHIGVVLAVEENEMTVAEGNGDHNRSVVTSRSCREKIAGFIRIDLQYRYREIERQYDPLVLTR
jgi:hypothetical protein